MKAFVTLFILALTVIGVFALSSTWSAPTAGVANGAAVRAAQGVPTVKPTAQPALNCSRGSVMAADARQMDGPLTQQVIDHLYSIGTCINLASYSDVPYVPRYAEPTHR